VRRRLAGLDDVGARPGLLRARGDRIEGAVEIGVGGARLGAVPEQPGILGIDRGLEVLGDGGDEFRIAVAVIADGAELGAVEQTAWRSKTLPYLREAFPLVAERAGYPQGLT
jgi:hypothetical protein